MGLKKTLQSLASLHNTHIEKLELIHLVTHHGLGAPCVLISANDSQFIHHTNLKHLDMSENMLVEVDKMFFHNLPKTLERLILRNN